MTNLTVINAELMARIEELAEKDPVLKELITKSYNDSECTKVVSTSKYHSLKQVCLDELEDSFVRVTKFEDIEDKISETISSNMYTMNYSIAEMIFDPDFDGTNRVDYDLQNDDVYSNIRSYADEQLRDDLRTELKELYEIWLDEQE